MELSMGDKCVLGVFVAQTLVIGINLYKISLPEYQSTMLRLAVAIVSTSEKQEAHSAATFPC